MTRRYYHPDLPSDGGIFGLSETESRHASQVMRVQPGDELEIFDGAGHQASAVVQEVTRKQCVIKTAPAIAACLEPDCKLHLAIALPKPDRAKELVERLTELGVHRVIPVVADRTQRPPSESLIGKLRRGVIEASKQCGRNRLMQIDEPTTLAQTLTDSANHECRWIAHPDGEPATLPDEICDAEATALIGPEGGWTDNEVQLAMDAGFERVTLGKRIYRIETAAVVVSAMFAD